MKSSKNVRNATVAGASTGGAGAIFTTWAALELQRRTGIPAEVGAGLIATPVAFMAALVARWAARLNPHE